MTVFKEIKKADKSGVTQFFRLSAENATVETNTAPDFYTFKGNVSTRTELPTSNLSTGDAYYIEDEDKVVFWTSGEWANVETYAINYNYENASNKPSINGHVLKGQMTAEDLDLQPAGDYLTEVPSEYITEDELAAEDYASKTYVMDQINNAEHFHREIVDALPLTGKDNVLYLVPKKGSNKDVYNEYIWTGTDYELMGTTAVDLSDYYTKEEADKLLDKKVDKVGGKGLSTNDYTNAEKTKLASLENYDDTQIKAELATLHNYDDTDIKNDITALKTAENGLKMDVSDIKEELKDKIEGVRLVRSGDMWDFYTVGGTRLTYETARELLGHPNTILYMEGVENDGKTTPADYDIDEELIHVHYMDEDGEDRYLQMGYPNTASAEGSNIHIADAVAQPISELKVDGVSEQKMYTGKNLLNLFNTNIDETTVSGITYSYDHNTNILTLNGTATAYIYVNVENLKLSGTNNYYMFCVIPVEGTKASQGSLIGVRTLKDNSQNQYIQSQRAEYFVTTTLNNKILTSDFDEIQFFTSRNSKFDNFKCKLQIIKSSNIAAGSPIDTNYEPYVGGQLSPSPDYPQEIKTITDSLSVINCGKNLFNAPYNEKNKLTYTATRNDDYHTINYYANLEANKTYTFSCKTSGTFGSSLQQTQCFLLYEGKYDYLIELIKKEGFTFTPLKTGKYFLRYDVNVKGETHSFWDFQIEEGSTSTNYESYIKKVVNIDLKGNKLCSLPNGTKDELIIENNRAKINKKIGKVVLDGSENWIKYDGQSFEDTVIFGTDKVISKDGYNDKCDMFQTGKSYWLIDAEGLYTTTSGLRIRISKERANTVDEFKTWLSTHNTIVQYELAKPKTIDLGEIDMPATFEGVNNITIDSDLNPNMKIDYVTNVNYLDKNIGFKNHYIGYYEDAANLPTGNKGDIATVSSDKRIYINDGNEWIPSDKNSTIDLSNYLAKDNTTGYAPTGNYNPATKKYVDDSIKGINIPTKTSQLTNDSNFVIKTTNELTNYYTKNNTYTKNEVNALVAGGGGGSNVSITVNGDTLVITTEQGGE